MIVLRQLFDNSFKQWKVIPLFFINKTFGECFRFYSNFSFRYDTFKFFPSIYKSMFLNWINFSTVTPSVSACIQNQVLRFNRFIKINNKSDFYKRFSLDKINFLMQMVYRNGIVKIGIPLDMKNMTYKTIVFPVDAT